MIRTIALATFFAASAAMAVEQAAIQRVAADAAVIDRVAEVSRKDLPVDLLKRIVNEDIELLRGKRKDGSYEFATYERLEASRISSSHSVQPRKNDEMERIEMRGSWVYRLIVSAPSRRLVMTKNRRVFLDRVELEYIPEGSSDTRTKTIPIQEWLEPGGITPIDFPEMARQATARLYAKADAEAGYGNIVVSLVQARIVDNADSPYADAVASAKAMLRAIDGGEVPSIRAMASRVRDRLGVTEAPMPAPTGPAAQVEVVAKRVDAGLYTELQVIEDLLTGTDSEKRQGLDQLHQLVRKLRP
ncbi:MAG TPA: hypothetical protein VFM36_00520 [Thermoanaerobaculia bacterium]|nr:hypothetical protein [Thermoanaerobaculia bacterium]